MPWLGRGKLLATPVGQLSFQMHIRTEIVVVVDLLLRVLYLSNTVVILGVKSSYASSIQISFFFVQYHRTFLQAGS